MITPEDLAKSGSEDGHQLALLCWAALNLKLYPDLKWLHHSPNGGFRDKREGAKFKAMGVKKGFPDLELLVRRVNFPGLLMELKTVNGVVSTEQQDWIDFLTSNGYAAYVVRGWEQARDCIIWYLNEK